MSDASKAKLAIEEFERENPATGGGRKKLIDWMQWKRIYGVIHAYTVLEGEVLMDIDDYFAERANPRGKSREESDQEFQALASQNYDREGEGPALKCGCRNSNSA